MDTAYSIFEYNINNFCAYISYQTNTPLSYIKQKTQITYIDNYLKKLSNNKKVFIYENEYIDKYYLEDYTSYYAQCFYPYKKICSRVHFFDVSDENKDYKNEFKKFLNNTDSLIKKNNYLGYIVIRPIPKTFLARICLKSYYKNSTDNRYKKFIILKHCRVSLFGISLEIDSLLFQEQDKILSACATTSLWTFLHASYKTCKRLPSSSAITKSAYSKNNGYEREFPNRGLSTEMICRSLRTYSFAPEYFDFSKDLNNSILLLKEYIYAYCSSNYPLILGVDVKDKKTGKSKGLHAITIVGYSIEQDNIDGAMLISHKLKSLYAHDDRYGPFLKISFDKKNLLNVKLKGNSCVSSQHIKSDEIYTPDTLILGLYHKIRIPYLRIKETCLDLQSLIFEYFSKGRKEESAKIIKSFQWNIQIKKNTKIKSEIFNNNDIKNKENLLTQSWPKYLWSATGLFDNTPIFEMLFDATDIDQGNVFIEFIPHNINYANIMIDLFKIYSYDYFHNKINLNLNILNQSYVWGIIKYFKEKESYIDILCDLYGYLKIPKAIKNEELTKDNIINKCEVKLNKENNNKNFKLDKNLQNAQYIWVIDKEGFLCIGREEKNSGQGHPTLTDGMPARIGGQLIYNTITKTWEVDPFSGRYSSEYSHEEKIKYVKNAIKYKFALYFLSEKFTLKEFED